MTTTEMVLGVCEKLKISQAELARCLEQTPQNLSKKMQRENLTLEELRSIADIFKIKYEQRFIFADGTFVSTVHNGIMKLRKEEIDMTQAKKLYEQSVSGLAESVRNGVDKYVSVVAENAAKREYDFGVQHAVESFLDAEIMDDEIVKYLIKYWDMDQRSALDAVAIIKTIEHPKTKFKEYLRKNGYSEREINKVMLSWHVGSVLSHNHELWKMTPEQLEKWFQNAEREKC